MKQVIRFNTFETNSSSIHSISIFYSSINHLQQLEAFDMECNDIITGKFRWEFKVYRNPIDILSYLYTYLCELNNKNLINKLKEYLPNTHFIEPIYVNGYLDIDSGYIDHYDSFDNNILDIFESKEKLADCMFSGEIRTANDNSDTEGFFNDSAFITIYKYN